jgi:hypothetical protein
MRKRVCFLLLVLCGATASADVLLLKDGSRLTVKLRNCDEDRCVTENKQIPMDQIVGIELRSGQSAASARSRAGAVTIDGAFHPGAFTGLSISEVNIGDEVLDRADVAFIVVAGSTLPATTAPRDVLIANDDVVRAGVLTKCDAVSCTLDGKFVPLTGVSWIGLNQEGSSHPSADDTADIIFRTSQSEGARFTGLDATNVRSTHGSFLRADVLWIHLAPPLTNEPGMDRIFVPDPDPPKEPPPPPPPPPPPKKTDPPPPKPPGSQPPSDRLYVESVPGALWTGEIKAHWWGSDKDSSSDMKIDQRIRLRELTHTYRMMEKGKLKTIASITNLRSEGSSLHNKSHMQIYGGADCKSDATIMLTTDLHSTRDSSGTSVILRRVTDDPMPSFGAIPVPRGRSLYLVGVGAPVGSHHDENCTDPEGGDQTNDMDYFNPLIGRPWLFGEDLDPEMRYVDAGKMIGSYQIVGNYGNWQRMSASWSICREGVVCPPLPSDDDNPPPVAPTREPPDKKKPCDELKALVGRMKGLADASKAFTRDLKTAEKRRAVVTDQIWGRAGALRKYFSSMVDLLASGLPEGMDKLKTLLGLGNMAADMSGDPSEDVKALLKALDLDEKSLVKDELKKQAAKRALNKAWEAGRAVYKQTGDADAALAAINGVTKRTALLKEIGDGVKKVIEVQKGIRDYAEKTSTLGDLVSEWTDYNENAKREQKGKDDVDAKMKDLQDEIDLARLDCPDGASSRPFASSAFELARYAEPPATPSSGGDTAAIASRLRSVRANLDKVGVEVQQAAPWLLPLIFNETEGGPPELVAALLKKAAPHFAAASAAIDSAVKETKALEPAIKRAIPDPEATPATPVAMLRHE